MAPAGWESNIGENQTNAPLVMWQNENGGYASSQDVMYQLPSGAMYMPDAAWITQERFDTLRSEGVPEHHPRRSRFRRRSPFSH